MDVTDRHDTFFEKNEKYLNLENSKKIAFCETLLAIDFEEIIIYSPKPIFHLLGEEIVSEIDDKFKINSTHYPLMYNFRHSQINKNYYSSSKRDIIMEDLFEDKNDEFIKLFSVKFATNPAWFLHQVIGDLYEANAVFNYDEIYDLLSWYLLKETPRGNKAEFLTRKIRDLKSNLKIFL